MSNKSRYINPMVDFAFKKIFGSESSKDMLIAFLNEVFRGRKHVVDLVYNKNEYPGDIEEEGAAVFDLLCTDENGGQFLIEIQRKKHKNFKQRALFYTSRLISNQAPKGKRSEWGYNLTEVYLIAILEDFTLEGNPDGRYLHDVCLSNRYTGEVFCDKLGYIYIELCNFVKRDDELETDLDRWLFALKHLSHLDKIPDNLCKPIFEKLFNLAEYSNLSKKEKDMYDHILKRRWDNKVVLDYALEESMEKGRSEGLSEGVLKGNQEKAFDIAREMKRDNLPIEQIIKFTKLSPLEVESL